MCQKIHLQAIGAGVMCVQPSPQAYTSEKMDGEVTLLILINQSNFSGEVSVDKTTSSLGTFNFSLTYYTP